MRWRMSRRPGGGRGLGWSTFGLSVGLAALLAGLGAVAPPHPVSAASTTFTVNAADDVDDESCDATHCSLREAIAAANANSGIDTIAFALAGSTTIVPAAGLPTITDPVFVDGTTQPGYATTPIVVLDGAAAPSGTDGLTITAGGSTVRGLSIGDFSGAGIRLSGGGANIVESSHIGVGADGTTVTPNGAGVVVLSAVNVIGGITQAQGNVITGNVMRTTPSTSGAGVALSGSSATGNQIIGNQIGIDLAGQGFSGNEVGVLIDGAPGNTVGGVSQSRNYISGSATYGVHVVGTGASGNAIRNNQIGGVYGGTGGDNHDEDVLVDNAPGTEIVGNTIEINQMGFFSFTTMVTVEGTGATGTVIQGNTIAGNGPDAGALVIHDAPGTVIGGSSAGEGNTIGNASTCLSVSGPAAASTTIEGNTIGRCDIAGIALDEDGATVGPGNTVFKSAVGLDVRGDRNSVIGNQVVQSVQVTDLNEIVGSGMGMRVTGDDNVIGGVTVAARNVVSGTARFMMGVPAVWIEGDRNTVQGNYIGTNAAGTAAYVWSMMLQVPPYGTITVTGNAGAGISVIGSDNKIGGAGLWPAGSCTGPCNLVAASGLNSSAIELIGGTGNVVEGNVLGTDVTGTVAIPNSTDGIRVAASSDNTVSGNLVASSGRTGVAVSGSSQRNDLTQNRIRGNGGLGIDLEVTEIGAVTPNDPGDGDAGPNSLQNFPVVTSATSSASESTVGGTLDSTPSTTFTVELYATPDCDASGHGEGDRFLGGATVGTDSSGHGTFTAGGLATIPEGWVVTATATDPVGNTSEFSACLAGVIRPNRPPTVATASGDLTLAEGTSGSTTGAFADPDPGDSLTVTCAACPTGSIVDHGDGSWTWSGTGVDGPDLVTVDISGTDRDGATASDSFVVRVDNVAPTVTGMTVAPVVARVGATVTTAAQFTDPGRLDTHAGTWSWGDGTTSLATIAETNGSGGATGSHAYARAGLYSVTLTVSDDDAASGTATFASVVVYDPTAGWVTGGGWTTLAGSSSAPGDQLPGVPAGTKAAFELTARYRTATGGTAAGSLEVAAGTFRLRSTGVDWLVVASPTSAVLQGSASINGSAQAYPFRAQLQDGPGADRIVLRIFAPGTNPDSAQPLWQLSGDIQGEITIHH
jgi:CSLREA domain-containing protein